jgi:hypothetical protein
MRGSAIYEGPHRSKASVDHGWGHDSPSLIHALDLPLMDGGQLRALDGDRALDAISLTDS